MRTMMYDNAITALSDFMLLLSCSNEYRHYPGANHQHIGLLTPMPA